MNAAVAEFRRYWWELLAARPEGFPWLHAAAKKLTGITVIDLTTGQPPGTFCGGAGRLPISSDRGVFE